MKTSIILISHGSKLNSGNDGLFKVADMLRAMNRWDVVEAAFLQLAEPGFPEVVKQTVGTGVDRIVVVPLLLFKGNHVFKDIPEMLENEKAKYPQVEFIYANNIGADERIALIADESVIDNANTLGKTRATVAMQHSISEMKDGIVVIGNAPTALYEIIDLIKKGSAQPALVIGIPVGFVGAVEAKYALKDISIPYITNTNRKGGSAVAVSIINAIIKLAKEGR